MPPCAVALNPLQASPISYTIVRRFCAFLPGEPEAEYNALETESMIYRLRPDPKFQDDAKVRLPSRNQKQITCLVHFIEWLQNHPRWNGYCPDNVDSALKFVRSSQ